MRVEITITGTVESDPRELVEGALHEAIEHGLAGGRADYSYGRQEGLTVFPDAVQAHRHHDSAREADEERKAPLREAELEEAEIERIAAEDFAEVDEVFTKEADDEEAQEGEDEGTEADAGDAAQEDDAEEEQAAVLDVAFGSVAAAQLADALNLTKADFFRKRKSGVKGFTKADVQKIADAKG